jgi:hypothetical protein
MRKRVICDENLPHRLRTLIPEHDLFSVAYMQWVGIKNGELLDVAERAHCDVLITSDQGSAPAEYGRTPACCHAIANPGLECRPTPVSANTGCH